MIFIWGNRRTERALGHIADYCPICRDLRAFRMIRVGLVGHVYYISLGSGKETGREMQCQECAVTLSADSARYAAIEKKLPLHLADLVQTTFPNVHAVRGEQLAQNAEMRSALRSLSPEQRATFLIEPFRILSSAVERLYAATRADKPATLGCLTTALLTIGILAAAIYLQETVSEAVLIALATVVCVGGVYSLVQMGLAPGRFLRAQTIPQLACALDPLQPTENELKECLQRCRAIDWKIGSKIKPRHILAEIERRRSGDVQIV